MFFTAKIQTIFILALVGVLDTLYLTQGFLSKEGVVCLIDEGCDIVTTSVYSTWGGIPVVLVGLAFYLFVAVLSALIYYEKISKSALLYLKIVTSIAVVVSLWFTYVQLFILEAICEYCILSALLSMALFVLAWIKTRDVAEKGSL
jgi:uncharacterized membrane protein